MIEMKVLLSFLFDEFLESFFVRFYFKFDLVCGVIRFLVDVIGWNNGIVFFYNYWKYIRIFIYVYVYVKGDLEVYDCI